MDVVSPCNGDGFALNLGLEPYKNIQDFYVGNFLLTFNGHDFLSKQLHGECFSCSFNVFFL